jgi:hypothetical protein
MFYTSGEDIADGFDTAMRMPWESGQVVFGNVTPKVIEQQKRVELSGGTEAEGAAKMHSRTFERRLGLDHFPDGTKRHNDSLPLTLNLSTIR